MTTTQALRTAASRVRVIHQDRGQFVLQTWSTEQNAWWVSHAMDRQRALAAAWEAKVREALELLGYDRIEAGAEASVEVGRGEDWRTVVRRLTR